MQYSAEKDEAQLSGLVTVHMMEYEAGTRVHLTEVQSCVRWFGERRMNISVVSPTICCDELHS